MELRQRALDAFCEPDPQRKVNATHALWEARSSLALQSQAQLDRQVAPGRPILPRMVKPQQVPRRSPFTALGHAALMHSIAHIEFNAINLALDAVWRFAQMPADFYQDWLRVADEEARHFSMLQDHLHTLGYTYGDFPAHEGLWTLCEATRHSVTSRMALVPRTLEARGLDATPVIQEKLLKVGNAQALAAVAILDAILTEEVGHVAIGNRWYHWLCKRDGLDPRAFYAQEVATHRAPAPKPPFNLGARRRAGFTEAEIQALTVRT
jgi:uncharacterized ferritin-like protein (DUF455 family)